MEVRAECARQGIKPGNEIAGMERTLRKTVRKNAFETGIGALKVRKA